MDLSSWDFLCEIAALGDAKRQRLDCGYHKRRKMIICKDLLVFLFYVRGRMNLDDAFVPPTQNYCKSPEVCEVRDVGHGLHVFTKSQENKHKPEKTP